jgi:hypothetical protein
MTTVQVDLPEDLLRAASVYAKAETQRASQSGWIHIARLANSAQLTTWYSLRDL